MVGDEASRAHERKVILSVLTLNAGFDVFLVGDLYVRGLEDGRFAVGRHLDAPLRVENSWEKIFDTPKEAVDLFLKTRHDLHIGSDYEDAYMAGEIEG